MKRLLFLLLPVYCFGQIDTTIIVNPSKDTTKIKIKMVTVANTTLSTSKSIVITSSGTVTPLPPDTGNTYARKNLIFESLFTGSDPFSVYNKPFQVYGADGSNPCTTCIVASSAKGIPSAKFLLKQSDPPFASAVRAELYPKVPVETNADRWLGIKYFFPSSTMSSDGDYDLIAQWHPNSGTGSPPVSLRLLSGQWNIAITNDANFSSQKFTWTKLGAYKLDQWNDVVLHYKAGTTATTGWVQLWINGVLLYDKHQITTFSGYGNYLKFGDNKSDNWPGNQTGGKIREFYIAAVRYGNELATYNDVAP